MMCPRKPGFPALTGQIGDQTTPLSSVETESAQASLGQHWLLAIVYNLVMSAHAAIPKSVVS